MTTSSQALGSPTIPGRFRFLTEAKLEKVITELPTHLRPVIQFTSVTGWRKSEVLGLQWNQVDFNAGEVRLAPGSTKNKQGRTFPFANLPLLAELLKSQREVTQKLQKEHGFIITHVFHHRSGKPIASMDGAWRVACWRAGLAGTRIHDLRRTAAREMSRAGVPQHVVMKLLGHKADSMFRRYSITDAQVLQEGVEKLSLHHATSGKTERTVIPIQEARDR